MGVNNDPTSIFRQHPVWKAAASPAVSSTWISTPLAFARAMASGLTSVTPLAPVPMHQHPGIGIDQGVDVRSRHHVHGANLPHIGFSIRQNGDTHVSEFFPIDDHAGKRKVVDRRAAAAVRGRIIDFFGRGTAAGGKEAQDKSDDCKHVDAGLTRHMVHPLPFRVQRHMSMVASVWPGDTQKDPQKSIYEYLWPRKSVL